MLCCSAVLGTLVLLAYYWSPIWCETTLVFGVKYGFIDMQWSLCFSLHTPPHPTTSNLLMLEQREIGFSCSNNLGDNHTQASLVWWEGGLYVRYGFFLYVQI